MAAAEIGAVTRQQLVADRIVVEKHRRIQMIEPGERDHRDTDRKDDWRPASPLLSGHLECRRDAGAHGLLLHHAAAVAPFGPAIRLGGIEQVETCLQAGLERTDHVLGAVVFAIAPVAPVTPRPAADAEGNHPERTVAQLNGWSHWKPAH